MRLRGIWCGRCMHGPFLTMLRLLSCAYISCLHTTVMGLLLEATWAFLVFKDTILSRLLWKLWKKGERVKEQAKVPEKASAPIMTTHTFSLQCLELLSSHHKEYSCRSFSLFNQIICGIVYHFCLILFLFLHFIYPFFCGTTSVHH